MNTFSPVAFAALHEERHEAGAVELAVLERARGAVRIEGDSAQGERRRPRS